MFSEIIISIGVIITAYGGSGILTYEEGDNWKEPLYKLIIGTIFLSTGLLMRCFNV